MERALVVKLSNMNNVTFHNRIINDNSTRTGVNSIGCYEATLHKKTFSDGSTGYYLIIKKEDAITEVKLKAYQYVQLKKAAIYDCVETNHNA